MFGFLLFKNHPPIHHALNPVCVLGVGAGTGLSFPSLEKNTFFLPQPEGGGNSAQSHS